MGGRADVAKSSVFGKAQHFVKSLVLEDESPGANGLKRIVAAGSLDRMTYKVGYSKLTLFISGFWRSGTTWLQQFVAESLAAKTIFEPLSPKFNEWDDWLRTEGIENASLREVLIHGPVAANHELWSHIDKVLNGRVSGYFSLLCRQNLAESLRAKIVLKDVRLQLNLPAVFHRYGVPIVHIRRHPCAVAASLSAARWDWSFRDIRLSEVAEVFGEDVLARCGLSFGDLKAFDGDEKTRIAALWAITERIASEDLEGKTWGAIVGYEDVLLRPDSVLDLISERFGLQTRRGAKADVDSPVTSMDVKGTDVASRSEAWKKRLSSAEIEAIAEVVARIYPQSPYTFA